MIESIYIAMTGLRGYESGLRLIANNTANLNTPGFKGSTLQFADLFYSTGGTFGSGMTTFGQYGYGLTTLGTTLDFAQGQLQNSDSKLDLAVDGIGMFVLRAADGTLRYTRDGQFTFDAGGVLVSATTGEQVMGLTDGALGSIRIDGAKTSAAKATATVTFAGNLSSTATTATVSGVVVIDGNGTSHTLSVKLEPVSGTPGTWSLTLLEGTATVGTGQVVFVNGKPDPVASKASVTYMPAGKPEIPLVLDFSQNVTSYDSGSRSTLQFMSQDGFGPGDLVGTAFDKDGVLHLSYTNGQIVDGARLALARYASQDDVVAVGNNAFVARDGRPWETGVAGKQGFGAVRSGVVEASNVDLSEQFSDLVIMQRGYQASSQVISTANEMLIELFGLRGTK